MSGGSWPAPPTPNRGQSTWMLSLVDTLSLLLCFFILIFSMGTPDPQRFREVAASLSRTLPTFGTKAFAPQAPPASQAPVLPADFALNLDYLASLIVGRVERIPALAGMTVERRSDRVVLIPPTDVAFAPGAARPVPAAAPVLGAIADLLAHVPNRLEVQASLGPEGSWEAALARSRSVVEALKQAGYGGEPAALAGPQEPTLALALLPTSGGAR